MQRFWKIGLAFVTTLTMAGSAMAQSNELSEIDTYQSILARAGYGNVDAIPLSNQSISFAPQIIPVPSPPGSPLENAPPVAESNAIHQPVTDGCACGECRSKGRRLFGGRRSLDPCDAGGCISNCIDQGRAGCIEPVYQPEPSVDATIGECAAACCDTSKWEFGVFGVTLRRDYEDRRRIAYNGSGTDWFTTDVNNGNFSGVGVSLGKRGCNGSGWESVFWGLSTADDVTFAGPTSTYLSGLADLDHVPSGATVWAIYNAGDDVRLYRDTEIYNFEFNLLRNGGQYTTLRCACANYELFAGFRLFQFNEELRYVSYSSVAGYPTNMDFTLDAENTLAGFQVGGRNDICLNQRLRFSGGASFGLFNNYIETQRRIIDETGYSPLIGAGPATGRSFDYSGSKNDAAVMAQFDAGLTYCFSQKVQARLGYRVMGVAGVALAAHQIPVDFTDADSLLSANANGELFMHGFVYGLEFCF